MQKGGDRDNPYDDLRRFDKNLHGLVDSQQLKGILNITKRNRDQVDDLLEKINKP